MFSIITLGTSSTTDLFASVGTLANDLWEVIALAIGVPLAFFIIQIVIDLVRKDDNFSDVDYRKFSR